MRKSCNVLILLMLIFSAACAANQNATLPPTQAPVPTQTPTAAAMPDTPVSATQDIAVHVTATATATATNPAPTNTRTPTRISPTATNMPTRVTPTATALPITPTPPALIGDAGAGAVLFAKKGCKACHMPAPNARRIAPDLSHVASDAAQFIQLPDYQGHATDTASYVRESILQPNLFVVPAFRYLTADGSSIMPGNFATLLSPQELEDVIAYVLTLAQ